MKKWIRLLAAAFMMAISHQAAAYDAIADVKITQIELTYMPQHIVFWADRRWARAPLEPCSTGFPRIPPSRGRTRMRRQSLLP